MTDESGRTLADVWRIVDQAGISVALIGAAALAVRGVSRSTADIDLLTTSTRVLDPALWAELAPGLTADVRRGDGSDPLAGIVRVSGAGARDVDLVVAKGAWARDIVERAEQVAGLPIRAARAADLILLKLYAGGSQDCWDIEQLLAAPDRPSLIADVDAHIEALPVAARTLWARLRPVH